MCVASLFAVLLGEFQFDTTLGRLLAFLLAAITLFILVPAFFSFMKLPSAAITFFYRLLTLLLTQAVDWCFLGLFHQVALL